MRRMVERIVPGGSRLSVWDSCPSVGGSSCSSRAVWAAPIEDRWLHESLHREKLILKRVDRAMGSSCKYRDNRD